MTIGAIIVLTLQVNSKVAESVYLPTPLPGSAISESMRVWIALICSA